MLTCDFTVTLPVDLQHECNGLAMGHGLLLMKSMKQRCFSQPLPPSWNDTLAFWVLCKPDTLRSLASFRAASTLAKEDAPSTSLPAPAPAMNSAQGPKKTPPSTLLPAPAPAMNSTQGPKKTPPSTSSPAPAPVSGRHEDSAMTTPVDDHLKWVHCMPYEYPPLCSVIFKNHIFHSTSQLAVLKATGYQQQKTPPRCFGPACAAKSRAKETKPMKQQQLTKKATTVRPRKSPAAPEKGNKKTETVVGSLLAGYKCKTCGKCFAEKYNLNKHEYLHKEKDLTCLNCGYVTSNPYMLSFHNKKCVDRKVFPCRICGETFKHHMQVYRHCKKYY